MRVLITFFDWQDRIEMQTDYDCESLEQAKLAAIYDCQENDFDHFHIDVLD